MVTVHILYTSFGKLQARMAIFSIKIDISTNHDICDLSNGIEYHVHGNGEQSKGVCDFSHIPLCHSEK